MTTAVLNNSTMIDGLDDTTVIVEYPPDDDDNYGVMSENEIPPCATRRKGSFAHGDVQKYRSAFDAFDFKKEGRICCKHIQNIVTKLGYRIPTNRIVEILETNELDETAQITFEQFLDIVPRNYGEISMEEHRLADLRAKFQQYDMQGQGHVSLQEAQWALQVELKVSPPTAFRLLNQFVKLNYEQFVDFYGKVQDAKLTIYDKFGRYDQDHDGMVSVEEAHDVLHKELGFTQERSRAMVRRFDTNKDGLVSYMEFAEFYIAVEEKKAKIRKAFQHFDKDRKGYVSNEEAEQILQGMLGFSHERCKKAIETLDKNQDGKIDYEEFLGFYSMLEEERERLLSEFNRYDKDQDGKISLEEFQSMLSGQGYKDSEIESLMAGYDLDKDGYLDFNEFKMFLNFRD